VRCRRLTTIRATPVARDSQSGPESTLAAASHFQKATENTGTVLAKLGPMLSVNRATPNVLRHLIYALHHASGIARGVTSAPWLRSSWGLLLNLPHFGIVTPGRVYRSGSARTAVHFRQILDLQIKTIICVRRGGPDQKLVDFAREHALRLCVYNLDHDGRYDLGAATLAARTALDPSAQPALVCCEGGRHHAGVVAALIRVNTGYSLDAAIAEYYSYAAPSPFPDNVVFIVRAAQALSERTAESTPDPSLNSDLYATGRTASYAPDTGRHARYPTQSIQPAHSSRPTHRS
jgi:hypothetical protein